MKKATQSKKLKSVISNISNHLYKTETPTNQTKKSKSKIKISSSKAQDKALKQKQDKDTNNNNINNNTNNKKEINDSPLDLSNKISQIKLQLNNPQPSQLNNYLLSIQNQIENSSSILDNQNQLFSKLSEINKEITVSDIKLEKYFVRSESEDYYNFIEKYASSLDEFLFSLKNQIKEIEITRSLKEENLMLKTKLDMLEMDNKDKNIIENSKDLLFKNYLVGEFNSLVEFIRDYCGNVYFNKFSRKNIDESSISLFFVNLKKIIREGIGGTKDFGNNYIREAYDVNKNNKKNVEQYDNSKFENLEIKFRKMKSELDYYKKINGELENSVTALRAFNIPNNNSNIHNNLDYSMNKRNPDNHNQNEVNYDGNINNDKIPHKRVDDYLHNTDFRYNYDYTQDNNNLNNSNNSNYQINNFKRTKEYNDNVNHSNNKNTQIEDRNYYFSQKNI